MKEDGISMDKYLDGISVSSDANRELDEVNDDWDTHADTPPGVEEVLMVGRML